MNEKEMIEKLKTNTTAFGYLTKEEQEFFKIIGKENCIVLGETNNEYWIQGLSILKWYFNNVYRIKSDYQPEPEYEDIELQIIPFVKKGETLLGIILNNVNKIPLYKIPSMPNFEKFMKDNYNAVGFENIAKNIAEGIKIFARLRKE